MKRVGIVNSGGDCPGLNRVIDAVVRTLDHKYEVLGFIKGFEGLLFNDYLVLNRHLTAEHRWMGGTFLKSTNKGHFPGKIRTGADKEHDIEAIMKAKKNYDDLGLEGLIVLGGDGTLLIANNLENYGFKCVGIPKSIDNDLSETDYTFGFFSAVETAASAIVNLYFTTVSHDRVTIVELMGRETGWITLFSGIAGSANAILIPEIPFSFENVLKHLNELYASGHTHATIAISEGVEPTDFHQVKAKIGSKSAEATLGGISQHLAAYINMHSNLEARNVVLGHLQRGGLPSGFDQVISMQLGAVGAKLFSEGKYGYMSAIKNNMVVEVKISDAVEKLKAVNPNSQLVQLAKQTGIYFGE